MDIIMIARAWPTKDYPTMGIFEADIAKALVRAGHKVRFLSIDMRSFRRKRKLGVSIKNVEGVEIYTIAWPIGAIPKKIFYKISYIALKKIYKIALKSGGKPDLLHSTFTDYNYLAAKLKEDANLPLYICENFSYLNQDPIPENLYKAAEFAFSKADAIQTVSPNYQRRIKEVFGVDSFMIENLTDLSLFKYKKNERNKNIFSVGRLTKDKGMDLLTEGFFLYNKKNPKAELHIFGKGPLRENLEKRAKEEGANLILHGLVEREEIAKAFEKADFFALASQHETFGLAYFEAMASGLPVLATYCGGPEHLFNKENSIVVEKNDIEGITSAMIEMTNKDFDREKISKSIREYFKEERIVNTIVEEMKRII